MKTNAQPENRQGVNTMTLHYNTICQNEKNAVYPHKSTINSIVDLETVVSYDHVCAEYKDGYRKNSNFMQYV